MKKSPRKIRTSDGCVDLRQAGLSRVRRGAERGAAGEEGGGGGGDVGGAPGKPRANVRGERSSLVALGGRKKGQGVGIWVVRGRRHEILQRRLDKGGGRGGDGWNVRSSCSLRC